MPFIIALIACSISLAGLYQTKSRVVGAARDGARAMAIKPGAAPDPDTNAGDLIDVVLVGPACPALTNTAYQSSTPPKVTVEAQKTYTVHVPFVGALPDADVTESVSMPCG